MIVTVIICWNLRRDFHQSPHLPMRTSPWTFYRTTPLTPYWNTKIFSGVTMVSFCNNWKIVRSQKTEINKFTTIGMLLTIWRAWTKNYPACAWQQTVRHWILTNGRRSLKVLTGTLLVSLFSFNFWVFWRFWLSFFRAMAGATTSVSDLLGLNSPRGLLNLNFSNSVCTPSSSSQSPQVSFFTIFYYVYCIQECLNEYKVWQLVVV